MVKASKSPWLCRAGSWNPRNPVGPAKGNALHLPTSQLPTGCLLLARSFSSLGPRPFCGLTLPASHVQVYSLPLGFHPSHSSPTPKTRISVISSLSTMNSCVCLRPNSHSPFSMSSPDTDCSQLGQQKATERRQDTRMDFSAPSF